MRYIENIKMKMIKTNNNSYDCFFGDGWVNCVRVRATRSGVYSYGKFGNVPENYMNLIKNSLKLK